MNETSVARRAAAVLRDAVASGGQTFTAAQLLALADRMERPDAQPTTSAAETLVCRTFDERGNSVCSQPAKYIVWGHLYEKRHKGPKCRKHLPPLDHGVPGFGSPAIYGIPAAQPTVLPDVETVREAILSGWLEAFDEGGKFGPLFDSALATRAVLALFPGRTEAEVKAEAVQECLDAMPDGTAWLAEYTRGVKAEALREAAEAMEAGRAHFVNNPTNEAPDARRFWSRWLRQRADRMGADRG